MRSFRPRTGKRSDLIFSVAFGVVSGVYIFNTSDQKLLGGLPTAPEASSQTTPPPPTTSASEPTQR